MSLDRISLSMLEPYLSGAEILCLGWPDIKDGRDLEDYGPKSIDCVDLIPHKGFEQIVDLNKPQYWIRQYDLVINPGTLEHCFNIGQAWENGWKAVKSGGRIMHVFPATMLNHGFWNICPIAVEDWCRFNGGFVESMALAVNNTCVEVEPHQIRSSNSGRGALPEETVLYAMCVKRHDLPIQWPVQAIYR